MNLLFCNRICLALSFLSVLGLTRRIAVADRAPVILVPGLAGSVLEEKLNRSEAPSIVCSKTSEWQVAWLSLTSASRPNCLLDELSVFYNETDKKYYNQTGVEIRAYQFGNLSGIAALDPGLPSVSGTYQKLIEGLQDAGYEEGKDLFGSPYDFRLAADGLQQVGFFEAFKSLIEQAVRQNDGQPAVIVAHSMGCLVSAYFLNRQGTNWKEANIAAFLVISAPLEGAVTALKGSISGDNFDAQVIPHDLLRPLQSTLPSVPWLYPAAAAWGDKVLVSTAGGDNYTAGDALKLLQDLNLTQQAAVYPFVHALTFPLPKFEFPVHCLYGVNVSTETGFLYDVDHFNGSVETPAPSKISSGDGDGTVNLRSLEACSQLGKDVSLQSFENATHLGLLKDERAIKAILKLLEKHSSQAVFAGSSLESADSWWERTQKLWTRSITRRHLTDRGDTYTLRHLES